MIFSCFLTVDDEIKDPYTKFDQNPTHSKRDIGLSRKSGTDRQIHRHTHRDKVCPRVKPVIQSSKEGVLNFITSVKSSNSQKEPKIPPEHRKYTGL